MADAFRAEVKGLTEVLARLRAPAQRAAPAVAGALYREGERIMTVAKLITPVETGALRASGHVDLPVQRGTDIEVTLGFGGPSAPYAVYVHERTDLYHRPPTQAKFLEAPARAAMDGMAARVGAEVLHALET